MCSSRDERLGFFLVARTVLARLFAFAAFLFAHHRAPFVVTTVFFNAWLYQTVEQDDIHQIACLDFRAVVSKRHDAIGFGHGSEDT